ncbi:gliding motility-associated ABC transporter ATP-binding subunit GldA [Algoriphagus sediminis]|uniref:Gliding motility-associated ABC transporter ATP-binding subunit GldA n=1 Tax=Algoriphagus sediminis TaxID=3057113 RepID=A0ABT7YFL1_9BACT|nr:gliding motility-associated ABC transporter ATP-binding subunit GldA [Algoriphagus sediminis]MDN3205314.1 gliding motility-associated ABC transporter ATP-binding subunit GldA [Algoriphagus sediminis]
MSLEVTQLTKIYGSQKALSEVSFSVKPGRILGFLGPNGAGKSTTMKIICGFISPDEGSVRVMGKEQGKDAKAISSLIGYLPENNPLYHDMYVKEFLRFSGGLYGLSGQKLSKRVDLMLDKTGLNPEKHKKISQLSKGYRQRVGLARALIHDPSVVILDEPTTGLDPNQLVEIRALIKEISENRTVILSTHIMQEVEAICDDVVIISKGEIKASESLENLKSKSDRAELILETEEELDLDWFTDFEKAEFGASQRNQVLIMSQSPTEDRKKLMSLIHEKELSIIGLSERKKGLEQIFREITK